MVEMNEKQGLVDPDGEAPVAEVEEQEEEDNVLGLQWRDFAEMDDEIGGRLEEAL